MHSRQIKRGLEHAPHRALLNATGVSDADMGQPFNAIVNFLAAKRMNIPAILNKPTPLLSSETETL